MLVLMVIVFCIMMLVGMSAGMLGWMLITHPFIVLAAIIIVALYETHKKDK